MSAVRPSEGAVSPVSLACHWLGHWQGHRDVGDSDARWPAGAVTHRDLSRPASVPYAKSAIQSRCQRVREQTRPGAVLPARRTRAERTLRAALSAPTPPLLAR